MKDNLKQDLTEVGEVKTQFHMYLLFKENPKLAISNAILKAMKEQFGEVNMVSDTQEMKTIAIHKYTSEFADASLPSQVLMAKIETFDVHNISTFESSHFYDTPNYQEVYKDCSYAILISDFMSSVLPYHERCELIAAYVKVCLSLYQDAVALWVPSSGKFLTYEHICDRLASSTTPFLEFGVNIRMFNIQDSNDRVVDTLGLYAIGLPDVQYHFHNFDMNKIVNHAYNMTNYIFEYDAPMRDGETMDGMDAEGWNDEIRWKVQYESSLIQPSRFVYDINMKEYASGKREIKEH